jgi:hypothetical protein
MKFGGPLFSLKFEEGKKNEWYRIGYDLGERVRPL